MRKTTIGGQAVIEGVMMRGKNMYALAVRDLEGNIQTEEKELNKHFNNKFFKLPFLRGIIAFIDSMILGTKIITKSVEMAGLEEDESVSKFEQFLIDKLGDKLNDVLMGISVFIALLLGTFLFMVLPVYLTALIKEFSGGLAPWTISLLEGVIRLVIFILYLFLISKNKDIQRVFMYHGAEHKTINCFEHEEPLTVENVKKYSLEHKRCGTSFLFIVMMVSFVFFMFVRIDDITLRVLTRIVFLPLVAGCSYEVLKLSGQYDNAFIRILSYPGLKLQALTTREPDDLQIEVAIKSMTMVLDTQGEDY